MIRQPSPRQLDVLRFASEHIRTLGYAPALEDICTKFGWTSKHTAWLHLEALAAKALIQRAPKTARAFRITRAGRRLLGGAR